jgi:putative transposase
VVQRGNNRQPVFFNPSDYIRYQDYLQDALLRYGVLCHAFVQMTNHVHLLLSPGSSEGISRVMSLLGNRYVQYFNRCYERSGTLWEGRHRSCAIANDRYFWAAQRYVELNPVRAGMVERPEGYYWSSYACNGLGDNSDLVTPHGLYLGLSCHPEKRCQAYRALFRENEYEAEFDAIRLATRRGTTLGGRAPARGMRSPNLPMVMEPDGPFYH